MKINKNNTGAAAEQLAATFLTQKGLKLVAQNYNCRFGEIDLVMQDGIRPGLACWSHHGISRSEIAVN